MIRCLVLIKFYMDGPNSKSTHISRVIEYAVAPEVGDQLEVLGNTMKDFEIEPNACHLTVTNRWIHLPGSTDLHNPSAGGDYDVEVHCSVYYTWLDNELAVRLKEEGYS